MNGSIEEGMPSPDEPTTTCPFCLIAEGKIETNIIYSDERFIGVLDINPASQGHVLLFPKSHFSSLNDMSDDMVSRMFVIAKKLCAVFMETLHAKGFNIFFANGQIAGQNVPHVILHLIPRYDQDGITFGWKPKSIPPDNMKAVADAIKSFSISEKENVPEVHYDIDENERIA